MLADSNLSIKDEEAIYRELICLVPKVKKPLIEPLIRVNKISRTGKVKLILARHARSATRNEYNRISLAYSQENIGITYADGSTRCLRTDGVSLNGTALTFSINVESSFRGYIGLLNEDSFGIVIGRGTTAFSLDDYKLETQIADGTGTNEMEYSAWVRSDGWNAGSSYWWHNMERVFDNNSSASIAVTESGLYMRSDGNADHCTYRDVFSAENVGVGESISVEYELRYYFP